jgi:hypothetical protein
MKVLVIVFFGYVCLVANAGATGTDRDIDKDGQWDYDKGGTDRDIDNDGQWDRMEGE